jgi:hypothetical protein
MAEPKTPPGLPDEVNADQLMWLLGGVSRGRISQMESDGVIERAGKNRYKLNSVPAAFIWLRSRDTDQTDEWRKARVRWMNEKSRLTELERLRAEGEYLPKAQVLEGWSRLVMVCRQRLLALPSKIAVQVKMATTIAKVAEIIRREIYEALAELSRVEVFIEGEGEAAE